MSRGAPFSPLPLFTQIFTNSTFANLFFKERIIRKGGMARFNPCWEAEIQEDCRSRLAWANSSQDPILQNNQSKMDWRYVGVKKRKKRNSLTLVACGQEKWMAE
jgi:hypothetical protein